MAVRWAPISETGLFLSVLTTFTSISTVISSPTTSFVRFFPFEMTFEYMENLQAVKRSKPSLESQSWKCNQLIGFGVFLSFLVLHINIARFCKSLPIQPITASDVRWVASGGMILYEATSSFWLCFASKLFTKSAIFFCGTRVFERWLIYYKHNQHRWLSFRDNGDRRWVGSGRWRLSHPGEWIGLGKWLGLDRIFWAKTPSYSNWRRLCKWASYERGLTSKYWISLQFQLCESIFGWRATFYVHAAAGLLIFLIWFYLYKYVPRVIKFCFPTK